MNKKILSSIAAAAVLATVFTGCGSSDSSSTATDITVERGAVYGAIVYDSSATPLVAEQQGSSNVYRFATAPTYPIFAADGVMDLNGNGTATQPVGLTMKSFRTVITPVTTYISRYNGADSLEDANENLANLAGDLNVDKDELLKVASKASKEAVAAINSLYVGMVDAQAKGEAHLTNMNASIAADYSAMLTNANTSWGNSNTSMANANYSLALENIEYAKLVAAGKIESEADAAKKQMLSIYNPAKFEADKIDVYNNMSISEYDALAINQYAGFTYSKTYRSAFDVTCPTAITDCTLTTKNGDFINVIFAYNANVSDDLNSNSSLPTNSNTSTAE